MLLILAALVIWGVSAALMGGDEPSTTPTPVSSDRTLSQAGCHGAEQTLQNLLDEINASGATLLAPNVIAEMHDAEAMMASHAANTPDPGAAKAIAATAEHLSALLATIVAVDGEALVAEAGRTEQIATDLGLACALIGAPLSLD
ncbi:MAG: hypothetical protein ACRDTE_20655 [Pseudonocardiaceae bacterium]